MDQRYRALRQAWDAGQRDRETALQLLFLSYEHNAEPDFVSGMAYDPDAPRLFVEIFNHLGGEQSTDPEFLFVCSTMLGLFPWAAKGEVDDWIAIAKRLELRAAAHWPKGPEPEMFDGRGDYGEYFAHIVRSERRWGDFHRKMTEAQKKREK